MKVVICGCGKIGRFLVSTLIAEGHDVTAIDNRSSVTSLITDSYDAMCVCGDGMSYDTMAEAGVSKADVFIATTPKDELNLVCCQMAKQLGAKYTVARVSNPAHSPKDIEMLKKHFGISMVVNPEYMTAQELFNIIKVPSSAKIEMFARRRFEMVEIVLKDDSPIAGEKLKDIRKKHDTTFLICVVQRDGKTIIPDGEFTLQAGDKIGISTTPNAIQKLLKNFGILQKNARSVMLLGASSTALHLSKFLLGSGNAVKIIEKDLDRCHSFGELLPEAFVMNIDGASQEGLHEAGLPSSDVFVSLTGMDEENILVSYFAGSQGVRKVITKVNRPEFSSMAARLGLDCVISPTKVTANVIIRYVRALENSIDSSFETLYKIMDNSAEAIEFKLNSDCILVGKELRELSLKKNVLISGIIRGRKTIIPTGSDMLKEDDRVIILSTDKKISKITDILM